MSSIRPLITITILVVVGAYLYVKINEGPVQPRAATNNAWNQQPDGVPPLVTTKGATPSAEGMAPAWPSTAASPSPPATTPAPAAATLNPAAPPAPGVAPPSTTAPKDNFVSVPPIPDIPELPSTVGSTSPKTAQPSVAAPKELPDNIPTAHYPDQPGQASNAGATPNASVTSSPLSPAAIDPLKASPSTLPSQASVAPLNTGSTTSTPAGPPTNNALQQPAVVGVTSPLATSQTSAQNPLRPAPQPAPAAPTVPDRYANSASPPAPLTPASTMPSQTLTPIPSESFAASWPAIQAALDRNDLKGAHQLLSKWHGNESLTPTESEKVETLLGQLAGTVIYSTEHQLEPARVVKQGETLDAVAKEYGVPWQLLAKINNIPAPDQVRAGQELKVVRGPFSAVVDLRRNEVALMVQDRYAGKFRVTSPSAASLGDTQWVVDQKLAGPPNTVTPVAFSTPQTPAPTDRTIILRSAAGASTPASSPILVITSSSATPGLSASPPTLRVSPKDAEELSDILSIGSRVAVRR